MPKSTGDVEAERTPLLIKPFQLMVLRGRESVRMHGARHRPGQACEEKKGEG